MYTIFNKAETQETGTIRVVGDWSVKSLPPHVQKCWNGMVLPCLSVMVSPSNLTIIEPVTNRIINLSKPCFLVPQQEALDMLKHKDKRTWHWWKMQEFPIRSAYFCFTEDHAHILSGVTKPSV